MVILHTFFCNLLSLIKYYLEKIIAGRDGGKEGERGSGQPYYWTNGKIVLFTKESV